MSSSRKRGAASAAPAPATRQAQELAEADQWEADALSAIEAVETVAEAESLLAKVATVAEGMRRLGKVAGDRERRWQVIKLRAERGYGELLGPAVHGGNRKTDQVDSDHLIRQDEKDARKKARKLAALPADKFEDYIATEAKPTREGLLRKNPTTNNNRSRKHGGEQTIKSTTGSVIYDVEILNWVRRQTRRGLGTKAVVDMSRTDDGYPAPDSPLTDGSLTAYRCAIHHLEEQGAAWPLRANGATLKARGPTRAGKRLHELGQKRAAVRRSGDPIVVWDTAFEITKLTGLLISLDIEDLDLDEHGLDILNDLDDDLLFLQDWMLQTLAVVEGRLGEQGLRKKIAGLRAKTVAAGATIEEAESAQRIADRLERRLTNVLTA